jgi:uncharacterized membrane protein YgcG
MNTLIQRPVRSGGSSPEPNVMSRGRGRWLGAIIWTVSLGALSACASVPAPLTAYGYRAPAPGETILLAFTPGGNDPVSADARRLRDLRATVDPRVQVLLIEAPGPAALPRANRVARLSRHPILLRMVRSVATDAAWLLLPPSAGITSEACATAAGALPGGFLPEGDFGRLGQLMPPGCSTASAIAAQTTQPSDLLMGRDLPPGASTPYADLIESYDNRNKGNGGGGAGGGGGGGGGGGELGGGAGAGNAAATAAAAGEGAAPAGVGPEVPTPTPDNAPAALFAPLTNN